ncbi:MAG: slipin family protein [Steroidobacteraceae bacterium]
MNPVTSFLVFVLAVGGLWAGYQGNLYLGVPLLALAVLVSASLKMANVWQKFVILRMGKLQSVRGAGLFVIVPVIDSVVAVIDERIQTNAFNAEQALTRDTVPVNVDAIIFWHVHDAEKAALAITDYRQAIDRVAQTSLREMIGASMLAALLSDRKEADERLKAEIGEKTAPWGISVTSVEIRDVAIPEALQNAMSRQAQAEREKQARVILGSAEAEIASKFVEAAAVYAGHPWALQLRAMNIIYETTKERGATILMPSSMVDSLNPSASTLALALAGNDALASSSPPESEVAPATKAAAAAAANGARDASDFTQAVVATAPRV